MRAKLRTRATRGLPAQMPARHRESPSKRGLTFLGSAGATDFSLIEESVRNLGSARNRTYLEHGYVRVSQEQAARCLEWSVLICEHLLGNLDDKRQHFEMQF